LLPKAILNLNDRKIDFPVLRHLSIPKLLLQMV